MSTSITIHTDDMALVAKIATMVAESPGGAQAPAKSSKPTPAATTVVTQPVAPPPAVTAPAPTQPVAPAPAAPAAAPATPPAAVSQEDRLKNAIKFFLQSPGQDAAKCAVIMREFTNKKVVGKDGVERQSANRADVPPENIDACIAKLKAGMPAELQAQV
jgi:hypothetical protein